MLLRDLKLDDGLCALLRPLSNAQLQEMKTAALKEGFTDIVVWGDSNVIVDGQFRFRLWKTLDDAYRRQLKEWQVAHDSWKAKKGMFSGPSPKDEPKEPVAPPDLGFTRQEFSDREAVIRFIAERHPPRYILRIEDIQIDAEFRDELRKQTDQEHAEFVASVAKHGFLSPVIAWRQDGSISALCVDGHHRVALWRELQKAWKDSLSTDWPLTEPPRPKIEEKEFADRRAVLEFLWETQAARRNFSNNEMMLILGKLHGEAQAAGEDTKAAIERLSAEQGVSPKTVERAVELVGSVEVLNPIVTVHTGKTMEDHLKSGKASPSQAQTNRAASKLKRGREKVGEDIDGFVNPKTGKTFAQQIAEEATTVKRLRTDQPEMLWHPKYVLLDKCVDKLLVTGDRDQLQAATTCVRQLHNKLKAANSAAQSQRISHDDELSDFDKLSIADIPVKVNGTPIAEYKAKETATC